MITILHLIMKKSDGIYIASLSKVVVLCQKRKIPQSQQTIHKQKRKCSNKTTNTFNAIKKMMAIDHTYSVGSIYITNNQIVMKLYYIYLCVIFKKFLEVSKCEWFLVKNL